MLLHGESDHQRRGREETGTESDRIPANILEVTALSDAVRGIELQQERCSPAFGSQPGDAGSVEAKMIGPTIPPRMEKFGYLAS